MIPDVEQTQGSEERTCPLDGCFAFASEKLYAPEPPTRSVYLCPGHAREALDAGTATRDPPPLRARVAPPIALDQPLPGSGRLWGPASTQTPPKEITPMPPAFSAPQYRATTLAAQVLRVLAQTPRRQADLAADLKASTAGVNVAVHKLENGGLVKSKNGVYRLTPEGRAWVEADAAHTGGATETPTPVVAAAAPEASPIASLAGAAVELADAMREQLRDQFASVAEAGVDAKVAALQNKVQEREAELADVYKQLRGQAEALVNAKLADKDRQIEELRRGVEHYEALRKNLLLLQDADADAEPGWPVVQTDEQLLVGIQGRIDSHTELQEKVSAYYTLRAELLAPAGLDDTATDDVLVEAIHRLAFEGATVDQDYHALRRSLIDELCCPPDVPDNVLVATVGRAVLAEYNAKGVAVADSSVTPPPYPPAPIPRDIGLSQAIHALQEAKEAGLRAQELDQLYSHTDGPVPLTVAEVRHLVDLHSDRAEVLIAEAKGVLR